MLCFDVMDRSVFSCIAESHYNLDCSQSLAIPYQIHMHILYLKKLLFPNFVSYFREQLPRWYIFLKVMPNPKVTEINEKKMFLDISGLE